MIDFRQLPTQPYTLKNVTLPYSLISHKKSGHSSEGSLLRSDIGIKDGLITEPCGESIDMADAMLLPAFVDMHTHLDKGHILPRAMNPDGSFPGALGAVRADHKHWSAEDVYTRADFALRCAYAHGTRAIRTHLDCIPPQDEISWPVFAKLKKAWKNKIDLQGVCLIACDSADLNGRFQLTVDLVKDNAGVLGLVTYPMEGLEEVLTDFFSIAAAHELPVDLHVDETLDPAVETLRTICKTVIDTGFKATVTVGHVCSLGSQSEARAMDTLDLVAKAGINVVSLPMCNLYLQDRHTLRTPRMRGVTLVHEMKQRSIPVSFASDNTRDPFYGYGDLDMLEVVREATRIAHLDHCDPDWINAFTSTPANICGFEKASLSLGSPADFVVFRARNWNELLSRPQSDRIVVRQGQTIDRTPPDYSELDNLFKAQA